jgi:hypothetical protein
MRASTPAKSTERVRALWCDQVTEIQKLTAFSRLLMINALAQSLHFSPAFLPGIIGRWFIIGKKEERSPAENSPLQNAIVRN